MEASRPAFVYELSLRRFDLGGRQPQVNTRPCSHTGGALIGCNPAVLRPGRRRISRISSRSNAGQQLDRAPATSSSDLARVLSWWLPC